MNSRLSHYCTAIIMGAFALVAVRAARAQSDEWMTEERAKERYLCEWRLSNPLAGSATRTLDFCSNSDLPVGMALVEQDGWWGSIFENNTIHASEELRNKFKQDWTNSTERTAVLEQAAEIRSAESRKRERARVAAERERARVRAVEAQERERDFNFKVAGMDAEELCIAFYAHRYDSARVELGKRHVLSDIEWHLITTGKIAIGMSETALMCSWGNPEHVNRTLTARTTRKQYVYRGNQLVYVENGLVTAIQDTQ